MNLREAISTGVLRQVLADESRSGTRSTDSPSRPCSELQRSIAARAATLFALGMITGLWSAAALSGVVVVAVPRLALAAHLNGLLGCFWLLGFAFTVPMLSYGDTGRERVAKLMVVATYGNWLITLLASFLGVRGIVLEGELRNDLVAVLLLAFVVAPGLTGSVAWAWGLRKRGT